MSGGVVCEESSCIIEDIDYLMEASLPRDISSLLATTKKHIYFLESEIAQLKKACAEWSEVSQHNYQKAKTASLALEAIKAVVKATSNGETE